jgi:hypothetical protein
MFLFTQVTACKSADKITKMFFSPINIFSPDIWQNRRKKQLKH